MDEELVKMIRHQILSLLKDMELTVHVSDPQKIGNSQLLEIRLSIPYSKLLPSEKDSLGVFPSSEYQAKYGQYTLLSDCTNI